MCYNQYLYWLSVQAVLIIDIVKSSLSAADIIANPIIGTSLIISRVRHMLSDGITNHVQTCKQTTC